MKKLLVLALAFFVISIVPSAVSQNSVSLAADAIAPIPQGTILHDIISRDTSLELSSEARKNKCENAKEKLADPADEKCKDIEKKLDEQKAVPSGK